MNLIEKSPGEFLEFNYYLERISDAIPSPLRWYFDFKLYEFDSLSDPAKNIIEKRNFKPLGSAHLQHSSTEHRCKAVSVTFFFHYPQTSSPTYTLQILTPLRCPRQSIDPVLAGGKVR